MKTQKRAFGELLSKLAGSLNVEAATLLDALNADLDRLYLSRARPHQLRLDALESEIASLAAREGGLLQAVRQREAELKAASRRVEAATLSLAKRTESLQVAREQAAKLRTRQAVVDQQLEETRRANNKVSYDVMMKAYRQRERNPSEKLLRFVLTFFTLIGITIAVYLLWRSGK